MSLFGPKRRSRSRSSGMGKGVETVMTIAALGAVGVVGYFVLKSGKGVEEMLQTGGDFLKDIVDAGNSTGDWIADGSYWLQKSLGIGATGGGSSRKKMSDVEAANRGGESKSIVDGIKDAVGGSGYYKGVEKAIQENEDRSIIKRKDIIDGILGFGCGWLRKC